MPTQKEAISLSVQFLPYVALDEKRSGREEGMSDKYAVTDAKVRLRVRLEAARRRMRETVVVSVNDLDLICDELDKTGKASPHLDITPRASL